MRNKFLNYWLPSLENLSVGSIFGAGLWAGFKMSLVYTLLCGAAVFVFQCATNAADFLGMPLGVCFIVLFNGIVGACLPAAFLGGVTILLLYAVSWLTYRSINTQATYWLGCTIGAVCCCVLRSIGSFILEESDPGLLTQAVLFYVPSLLYTLFCGLVTARLHERLTQEARRKRTL